MALETRMYKQAKRAKLSFKVSSAKERGLERGLNKHGFDENFSLILQSVNATRKFSSGSHCLGLFGPDFMICEKINNI